MPVASSQPRRVRINAALAASVVALLLLAPQARAQDSFDPGVDQYVESLPTSKGDRAPGASRNPNSVALPSDVRSLLAGRGGADVPGATGGAGGAGGGASDRAAGRLGDFQPGHDDPVGSPSALSSAAKSVTSAGPLVWLLLGLGVVTIAAVSRALVRQRRAQE